MFAPSGFCKITEWLTEAWYNVATHMRLSTVVQRFNWFMPIQLSNKLIRSDGESRSRLATEFCSFVCLQHVHFSTNNNECIYSNNNSTSPHKLGIKFYMRAGDRKLRPVLIKTTVLI